MPRVVFPPKFAVETRLDPLDFSPFLPSGVTVTGVVALVTVYSGVDPGPTLTAVPAATSSFVNVTLTGGVLGVIYQVTVRATLSNGEIIPLSYFLAVIPDLT